MVNDVTEYVDVYVFSGGDWHKLQAAPGSKQVVAPAAPALDRPDRNVTVRIVARKNLNLTLPQASPAL
jgi:hypothetical protein